ncbi:related to brefeldin A resistance protein BFR1 (maintenance of normal ploidy) [Phialocephala subalpina]|uniref:Related to brefeldin A resistance protein BFR1 (Maintenance of normal ploidy) n=1 Tax=Phialocephala subalpina TaxID=576137 RepID=A0A1L7XPP1_9HELO|nr:related to brefeldin A resistance protein BFR1 (maintenance of normal ploidy) [Phialocephala subalpina]
MADVATPSGAAMFDGGAADKKRVVESKPEKPDEATYKESLAKAEKEHQASMKRLTDIKAKLDLAKPQNKDSPSAKRRAELLAQLKEIREKQGAGKAGRNKIFDEIKSEDQKVKDLIAAQKVARSRVNFKNVADLDKEIDRLQKSVDSGNMKIVDEKKALAEISNLRKQRKGFAGFEDQQKQIDDRKKKLQTLRDSLEDPESKALSEKYNKIQGELDTIKAEQDDAFKSINSLRDERTKLQNDQQEKYAAIKKIKDDYYQQSRAVQKYEYESRQRARERKKAENEKYHQEKKKERAQQMLAEASDKAYLDEIRRAESLLRFLDPSYTSEKAPLQAASQFTATAQRTVDDSALKGMKVVKKGDEEDYFAGTGGKKGKKSKNAKKAESAAPAKYNLPPSVIDDCTAIKVEPPMTAAAVPATLAAVKEKLDFWKKDQEAQTQKNIAAAKKEVEKLEAEEAAAANGSPATPTTEASHANGETKATASVDEGGSVKNEIDLIKSAVSDVTADLKGASIEDKE